MWLFHAHLANATFSTNQMQGCLPHTSLGPWGDSQGLYVGYHTRYLVSLHNHCCQWSPIIRLLSGLFIPPPSSDEDSDDQDPTKSEDVYFGLAARSFKRRRPPSTHSELDQYLRQRSLVFCHTGPHEQRQKTLNYVCSWIVFSNEVIMPKTTPSKLSVTYSTEDSLLHESKAKTRCNPAQRFLLGKPLVWFT